MPVMQTRGEVGGGVVAHLQCPHCGSFSKSHAHLLSHLAASHPIHLDDTAVGRLGNILMYQSGVRLFHCSLCFFNCRDFTKLYKHIITKHCMDRREEGGGGKGGDNGSGKGEDEEGKKDTLKRKRSSEGEVEGGDDGSEKGEEEEGSKDAPPKKRSGKGEVEEGVNDGSEKGEVEEGSKDALKKKGSGEGEMEEGGNDGSEKGEVEEGSKDALKKKGSGEGEMEEGGNDGSEKGEVEEGSKDALKKKGSGEGEMEEGGNDGNEKGEVEEGSKDALKKKGSGEREMEEGGNDGNEKGEGKTDSLKRQRSSEGEEEEGPAPEPVAIKLEEEGEKSELMEVSGYRCLICNWSHRQKSVAISHMVRKHNIPKAYANRGIKRDATTTSQMQAGGAEDEEGAGLTGEMLKEEMKATAKVIRFTSSRFVCLICGWKTKLKGFAISHVLRSHEVERPYSCKECGRSFFLPSRLQKHVGQAHRPGRYSCPFCWFRSEFLGGFKRHCSRCNAREEEEEGREVRGAGGEEEDNDEEEEEKKKTRAARRQSNSGKEMEEPEDEDDDD